MPWVIVDGQPVLIDEDDVQDHHEIIEDHEENDDWGDPPAPAPVGLIEPNWDQTWGGIAELQAAVVKSRSPRPKQGLHNRLVSEYMNVSNKYRDEPVVGLEIECEGKNLPAQQDLIRYWNVVPDGSLKPYEGHPPCEYVYKGALSLESTKVALDYLVKAMTFNSSVVVPSVRTSVHVHVNVGEWKFTKVFNYALTYLMLEELMVDFAGEARVGNLFCLRAKDATHQWGLLEGGVTSPGKLWEDGNRYTSMNLCSLRKLGTLEFRALRGTIDTSLILTWVEMLLAMRKFAYELQNPLELEEMFLSLGPEEFLKRVLPNHYQIFIHSYKLKESIWDAFRNARDVIHASDWK